MPRRQHLLKTCYPATNGIIRFSIQAFQGFLLAPAYLGKDTPNMLFLSMLVPHVALFALSHPIAGIHSSELTHEHYTIAWICAIPRELKAAIAVLDQKHDGLPRIPGDNNEYIVGSIGRHHVVMTCLRLEYGKVNAAKVSTDLMRSFPNIKATLMVGIGGGAPSDDVDLRLGDVVVGTSVVEYDLGKATPSGHFEAKRRPKVPAELLRAAVAVTQAQQSHQGRCSDRMLQVLQTRFHEDVHPQLPDRLFCPKYIHPDNVLGCDTCDATMLKSRQVRSSTAPWIYHGVIASGDTLMKDSAKRDDIAHRHKAICFEMEAAAMMDTLHCLPIRGICDYSDSHKNDDWQDYAAATAASWARELLEALTPFTIHHQAQAVLYNMPSTFSSPPPIGAEVPGRRKELLESLSFLKINARRNAISHVEKETCKWFLDLPKYKRWLGNQRDAASTGFLWLHGKAGAGKSTMMKFLDARARKSRLGTNVVSFFFHARGDSLQKSVDGLYRSLLYDTLNALPDLQSVLDDTTIIPSTQRACPDRDALKELLRNAIQRLGQRSLTYFIDALDECDENDARDMVEFLRTLTEESTELRICFSSRPYPCIETEPDFVLEREAGHENDLEKYLSKNLKAPKRLHDSLRQEILDKAKGVFLWVVLVVKILNDESRNGIPNLRQRLKKIPAELGELFKEMLTRDQHRPDELKLCILWVLCAKRPLNTVELRHAIWAEGLANGRYESDDDGLFDDADEESSRNFAVSSSKGLVEPDDPKAARPALQFIHESVRDFLIKERGVQKIWPELGDDWEANSHNLLMNCCKDYLSHPIVGKAAETVGSEPACIFLEYAGQHILHHANLASRSIDQMSFLSWFFASCGHKILDYGQRTISREYGPTAEPLYILADRGHGNLIRGSEGQFSAVSNSKLHFQHPLFAALANNHEDAVAALLGLPNVMFEGESLTKGLNFRKDMKDYRGRTPLSWAAQEGRHLLVKVLLKNGANPIERDLGRKTPLERAGDNNPLNPLNGRARSIICQFMYPGNFIPSMDSPRQEWLEILSTCGLPAAIRFIASRMTPWEQGAALIGAARVRWLRYAQILIENGAVVNYQDGDDRTALIEASSRGSKDITQLLIDAGADVNQHDSRSSTPLIEASANGLTDVVRILNNNNDTPLTKASANGHKDVAQLLLDVGADIKQNKNGTDVNQPDDSGSTALMKATFHSDRNFAQLLLDAGADVNQQDKDGSTALMKAISNRSGDIGVVKSMRHENGGDPQLLIKDYPWHIFFANIVLNAANSSRSNALDEWIRFRHELDGTNSH
ncbi:hypothetical protein B0I35DRAFT_450457 [Stachybotrys elegans]|uniref:NACHT domain-containing protein n=1 Tax=Stachybotrys elegans TaxID=80388 RepID=A0A8K0SPL8_9HYPO|nr:hypothetical protein B0I35DRAFT_450457 [Stachybotrys elegans]